MIDDVKEVGAQLHGENFSEVCVLVEREVPVFIRQAAQRIAAEIAEMAGAGNAVLGGAADAISKCVRGERAGDGEG